MTSQSTHTPARDPAGEARTVAVLIAVVFLVHALVWIALPSLLEGSIRLDIAEGAIGGPHWRILYPRHPPLTVWLTEVARLSGPVRYQTVYTISQVLALGGLAGAVWLAHQIAGSRGAILAAAMGLLSPYLTVLTIELNHNIGVMFFWGLTLIAGWFAFTRGTLLTWVLFGCAVGGGMWAKFAILHLVAGLGVAFLIVPRWRSQLLSAGPWVALFVGALIITPQIWELQTMDASPLNWAVRGQSGDLLKHLTYPLVFAGAAVGAVAPMAVIALVACGDPKALARSVRDLLFSPPSNEAGVYLTWAAIGPFLVITLAALVFGLDAKANWLTPASLSFAAFWAVAGVRAGADPARRRFRLFLAGLACLFVLGYVAIRLVSPLVQARPAYPDFDGPAMADITRDYWASVSDRPLQIIVTLGVQKGRQLGGSIAFDLDHPVAVFEDASQEISPWTSTADVRCRGALVASPVPITTDSLAPELTIKDIRIVDRPLVRGSTSDQAKAWLGHIEPGCS